MKTILHLIETSGPGGAENMLINLVQGLDKNRYQSIVCLLKEGWLNKQFQDRGIETVIIPQSRTLDVNWVRQARTLIKRKNIKLMHAHEFAMNTYSSILSTVTKVPTISTVHGKNYYSEKWQRRAAYRFVSRRSSMVAVSEDIRRFLINRIGIKNERIITIPNGINMDVYSPNNVLRTKIRNELNIDKKETVIGAIGNLYPVKGHTHLIKSAAIVIKQYSNTIFMIAGRGKLLTELQNEANGLGIQKNIIFLGFREDIPALLQAMDIFVLPSLSEGLPLSVLEAMAASKPLVSTNVGGIPEVITDGQSGLLVPPKDPVALAEKIILLLNNRELAERLAKTAYTRVADEFNLAHILNKYEKLYSDALQS